MKIFGNALVSKWKSGSVPWKENTMRTVTHNDPHVFILSHLKTLRLNLGHIQFGGKNQYLSDMHILFSVGFWVFFFISSYWCWLFWQLFSSFQCTISVWNVFIYNGKCIVFVIFLTFHWLDPLVADQVRSLDQVVWLCSVCYFNSKTLFYCSVNQVLFYLWNSTQIIRIIIQSQVINGSRSRKTETLPLNRDKNCNQR